MQNVPSVQASPAYLVHKLLQYQVRPPVLRQLMQELIPLAENDPEKGLALCDVLWEDTYLEFRTLGAMLLGKIPTPPSDTILNRIQTWIKPDLENFLIDTLLTNGLVTLRQEDPNAVVRLAHDWLIADDRFKNLLGSAYVDPNYQ